VDTGNGGGDGDGFDHLLIGNGPHGHHHIAMEYPGGLAGNVGDIHGHIAAHGVVAHFDAGFNQLRFKGKAAADEKAHQILPPKVGNIGVLSRENAVFIDTVLGNVRGNICAGSNFFQGPAAHIADFQNGAGLGIPLCKQQKVIGKVFRQHHQIGLRVAGAHTGSGNGDFTAANQSAHLRGGHILRIHRFKTSFTIF